jgi:hypothetical protein
MERRRRHNLEQRVRRLVDGRLAHDVWEAAGLAEALARRIGGGEARSAYGLAEEILAEYRGRRPTEGGP